ncbi:MAG: hypothetical protein WCK11_03845 [Candidatus Falkowbacteria bacterium]
MAETKGTGCGLVNAAMGRHAYTTTGTDKNGNETKGYGSDRASSVKDYTEKGGTNPPKKS